jgi:hypothetical protein
MAITISVGGIHLVNSTGSPLADGVSTVPSTTPFSIRQGGFTLQPPEPLPIFGGGPPFRPGSNLAYTGYDNVSQRIPIHVSATTHEIAVARINQLKRELMTGSQSLPALFGIQPTSSSTIMYTEILTGFVRELTEEGTPFEAWEARTEIDADLFFTHKPFFSNLATGETVISVQTIISGAFTGSPDNIVPFTAGAGDLLYEGQPLNLSLTLSSGTSGPADIYIATVDSVIADASTQTVTTASTIGAEAATGDTITVAPPLSTKQALQLRMFALNSTGSANAQWRINVYMSNAGNPIPFYRSPWNTNTVTNGVFDCGTVPANLFRDTTLTSIYALLEVRSTGGSVTVTLTNFYLVAYYTICRVSLGNALLFASADVLHMRGFVEASNRACLALPRAEAYTFRGATVREYLQIDGVPPVYLSGASMLIYAIGNQAPAGVGNIGLPVAGTFTLTARQAPLFKTLRGI